MGWLSAALAAGSVAGAHGLAPGGSHRRAHLHGAFSSAQARDLAVAWRLSDPRTGSAVQDQYYRARVMLSNNRVFVVAGWTDVERTDAGWTDVERTDAGGNQPRVSLYICMDHGDVHRVQMCLWGQVGASERAEALHALRGWHERTVGPHGPRLVIPLALLCAGDPGE